MNAIVISTPDWLAKRGGELKKANAGPSWLVSFDGQPHYRLTPAPAGGDFTCHLVQTENGRRLDKGKVYPSGEQALEGGLEDLRKTLGW
jgi:hypothetical protein